MPRPGQLFLQRVARGLLGLGAFVGVGAIIAWAFDWTPPIPDWMIRVAMFKLAFIAAAGLLAAGALLGRRSHDDDASESNALPRSPRELAAGSPQAIDIATRENPLRVSRNAAHDTPLER